MPNKNGIHHVVTNVEDQTWPKTSLCGKKVCNYDMPIGVEHAKECVAQGTYLQPCKNCMKKAPKEQE